MMLRPYKTASFLPPPFLRKNDTVIGIIGHTQGVKMASKPPRKPRMKIHNRARTLLDVRPASPVGASFGLLEYSQYSGAVHILSSQALKRIGTRSALASVITNESVYSSSNSISPNSMILMCQFGSMTAFSRTLSPISSPLHFTGSTICAANSSGRKTNIIVIIRFIVILFLPYYLRREVLVIQNGQSPTDRAGLG